MSEYQRFAFRAIDGPVSGKNLEYMRRQSSRAKVTPWAFDNEYNFGDFGGDALEMMRRGYDFHLHYANFGIRKLLLRLPTGLPDPDAAKPYLGADSLQFMKDKSGPGGVLCIKPFHEPGDLEALWEIDNLIDRLIPLRAEILDGDLRPLYLAHLVMARDGEHNPEETKEGPVPAGLADPSDAQLALADLYGISASLLAAAARGAPRYEAPADMGRQYAAWLQTLPQATKDRWLAQCMAEPGLDVRRQMLAEFRTSCKVAAWPTVNLGRTMSQLETAAEEIHAAAQRETAARAARQKAKRLAAMAADPAPTLEETEKLVAERSVTSYERAANLLTELREALAGSARSGLAEEQALKLKNKNPKLNRLISALRSGGLLVK